MRILFPKGKQKKFINKILLSIPIKEAADLCGLSERTMRDWRREKFLMSLSSLKTLCKKTGLIIPKNINFKDDYWYAKKGASIGGKSLFKKYGKIPCDPNYRKQKWNEWWRKKGKYIFHQLCSLKSTEKPGFSKKIAEFVGIMLGDGGISRYQLKVTLDSKKEKEYGKFVSSLIKSLFNVPVRVYYRKKESTVNFVVSRRALVLFCVQKLGLKIGNKIKQQIDIPGWITGNKAYSIACLRGLFDTDGCVFYHRYKVNGKFYNYKKISFTSFSGPLLQSAFKILNDIGVEARITKDRRDIRIESQRSVARYFEVVGFHNQRNLKKKLN